AEIGPCRQFSRVDHRENLIASRFVARTDLGPVQLGHIAAGSVAICLVLDEKLVHGLRGRLTGRAWLLSEAGDNRRHRGRNFGGTRHSAILSAVRYSGAREQKTSVEDLSGRQRSCTLQRPAPW